MRRLRSNYRLSLILFAILGLGPSACVRFGYDLLDDDDGDGMLSGGQGGTSLGSGTDGQAGAPPGTGGSNGTDTSSTSSTSGSDGGSSSATSATSSGGATSSGTNDTGTGGAASTAGSGGLGGTAGSAATGTTLGSGGTGGGTASGGSTGTGGSTATGGTGGSGDSGACNPPVDLFPVPVSDANTPFPEVDDSFLEVPFDLGFSFPFYGIDYDSVFLNTNGGLTFGEGDDFFTPDVTFHDAPSIAVFWSDMAADSNGAETRAGQLSYQQCERQFMVVYTQLQHWFEATWTSSATLSLAADGTIRIRYGEVTTEEILVGIFDGTHSQDQSLPLQASYSNYSSFGSGIVLFEDPVGGGGTLHTGELTDQTLVYAP